MKRVLFITALLTGFMGIASPSVALTRTNSMATDTVRKKIVHPKEAMTDVQATAILNAMRQKNTDAEKVAVLKERVKGNGITMDQLIKLLNQFLSDDSKLESAQFAFPYVTNYKSFLRIMDLFGQESYKFRLEDFYDANRK